MMKYFADLSEQSSQQVKPSQQQADMSTDAFSSPIEISLTRTVKAISYKVLANLFISEERSDIKNILKQLQKGLKLPPRLMTFLTASGLYKNDEITQLGFDVIKTGTLLSKERGIYEIWYIDDNYFGKMPVAIQRIEESQSHNGKNNRSKQLHNWSQVEKPQPSLRLNTDQATVYLINEAKLRKVSKLAIEVIDRGSASKSTQIKIKLDAPLDKANCHWSINGQITINTRDVQKSKEFEIKIPQELSAKLIEDLCEHSNMTWNKKHCRAEIDNIEPCKYLQDFNIRSLPVHDVNTIFGNFKQGIMRNLPIMPKFKIIASEWQEQWLNKLFIDDHVSPESMEYLQRAWLKHSAINHFDLPLLLGQELLRKLDGEKRINEVYWHAAASNYLMPKLTKMTLPSITFTDKQAISTEELLRALTLNSEINSIIYSDRHYKSKLHANNLCAIHNQCNPNVGVVFTTDPDVNVPTGWEKELVKNSRDNHDRYYIFIANTEIFTWKCSTSLDFANLSKEQSFTKGNCTFTRLRESELPLYLQDCLRKINEEVAA